MEGSLYNNPFEERENSSSDNSAGNSPPSTASASIHAISSPKTRRGIQKRVVTIPIKGDYTSTTPPSDSWAWRKYGQKPIKGSPYPRGYYRCSSSKGCPARKQVERSRAEPTLLVVTYSYEHNHSFPVSRNNPNSLTTTTTPNKTQTPSPAATQLISKSNNNTNHQLIADLTGDVVDSLITTTEDFDWTFANMETTSSAILDDPIFSNTAPGHHYFPSRYFPVIGEEAEEDSLFADLGELPECSVVFGNKAEEGRRRIQAPEPWCESSG